MRRQDTAHIPHRQRHPGLEIAAAGAAPASPISSIHSCARLKFSELYATTGIIGLRLSDKAKELAGKPVVITGYMAPPLDVGADFFVMTRAPSPACPFCDPLSVWPDDLVLGLNRGSGFADPERPIEVAGILDIGRKPDPHTGATRLVRLLDAGWRQAND